MSVRFKRAFVIGALIFFIWGYMTGNKLALIANTIDYAIALKMKGVMYPRVVLAQRVLESGNGTSAIYKENKNPYGLKLPKYRDTYAIGENKGHAVFNSFSDAVNDYVERQDYWVPIFEKNHYTIDCEDDYIEFLVKTGYAEDPKYADKIRAIIERDFWYLPNL